MSLKQQTSRVGSLFAGLTHVDTTSASGRPSVELEVPPAITAHLCRDHFEGDPLVPGAYLIGLAVEAARRLAGPVAQIRRAALRAPLRPEGHEHAAPGPALVRVSRDPRKPDRSRARILEAATIDIRHGVGPALAPIEIPDPRPARGPLCEPAHVRASLRHGPAALFVDRMSVSAGANLVDGGIFSAVERPSWHWTELLDGAAQAAGLCFRAQTQAEAKPVYVAAYERLVYAPEATIRAPVFRVLRARRVMHLQQFELSVGTLDGAQTWVRGVVTLAGPSPTRSDSA
ncbi:hypothetical protein ENSA5_01530 [Enhygromyxa salina]|uniref:Uncharacterized protein n=1 Tax=Enhygromyxa salina TaxID=215803 RepID=A0A2S9YL61_9BACT|nr:hypothetical protein [Enhygromyxa salina]PRQ05833.1 hypothetical protein ENSA5_01530 [Enhygromyxa salina]